MNPYDQGVTPMAALLDGMGGWIDKAVAAGVVEETMMQARIAPDMHPFPRQLQIASDMAKNAAARLAGVEAPSMPDDETTLAQLKARCAKTADYLRSFDRGAIEGAAERPIELKFPNGMALGFSGAEYLTHFVLPNFYFHATTAYALLRGAGVGLGKQDFMASAAPFMKAPPSAA